ncbi:hypothetical protein EDC04DRAFT_2616372 [Pisolithus marmoratus]|nr:hypothetical protein EDC04DRAFT_2616372 [Pisolithus marmoratus]
MGWPKLYKMQEERVLAAQTYCMKYYQRSDVTTCDTTTHSTTEIPLQFLDELDEQPICNANSHADSPCLDDASSNLEEFKELNPIEKINKSLKQVTGTSCHLLMDTLCQEYIWSGDYVPIWNVLCEVEGLETQYWDGSSDDPTENIFNHVWSVAHILEDLLTHVMEGTDVVTMYTRGMLRKEWTTPEQKQFLQDALPQYRSMPTKEYNCHFPVLFKDWCACWPERTITFPELPVNMPLTSEQEETLMQALSKCQEQI